MVLLVCYLGSPYDHRQESGASTRARQGTQLRQPSTQTHRLQPPAVLRNLPQLSDLWSPIQTDCLVAKGVLDYSLTRLTHLALEDGQGQRSHTPTAR